MISDFHLLSEKIHQLAELAQSLRRENADLRLNTADLTKRMQEAHERVIALLEKIPVSEPDEEEST